MSRLRSLWPYIAPLGFVATTLLHPIVVRGAVDIAAQLPLWLTLHVVQIPLIVGLAATLQSLTEGLQGRAVTVARAALWVFAPVYAAFDAVVGIGSGVVVSSAESLTGEHQAAVIAAADALFTSPLGLLLAGVGGSAWLVAATATAVARRRAGATGDIVAALITTGILFALTHVSVPGTAGALALVYAVRRVREHRVAVAQPHAARVR